MRNLDEDPIATAPGSDTLPTAIQFDAFGVMMARKKTFLARLVEFRPAVRLYMKAGQTARAKTVAENKEKSCRNI